MSALRQIISRFTGRGRRGPTTTGGAPARGGASHSQDAQIGRAVRSAVRKFTGKR
ncbi:hypothetical protein KLP28_03905 [Nocardioidaceae bacterium]|nr:hypothetical protein KLP28_03905 [Nocardioidaceae bacterium]